MDRPATPDEIKARMQYYAAQQTPEKISKGTEGVTIALLNRELGGAECRRLVVSWLFDGIKPLHTKDLTPQQVNGLVHWVGAHVDDVTGKWESRTYFEEEAISIIQHLRKDS
jgi:hypothetical protein